MELKVHFLLTSAETNATIIGNANVGYYNGDLFVYSQN